MKPMGTVSRNTGGDISTIIPDLIDTDTYQINTSVNYKGAKAFVQAGYYGSFFTNDVPFMSWQNWATGPTGDGTSTQMSSTPSNASTRSSVTGGYQPVARTTQLVANGSYARNTQNDTVPDEPYTPVVPVSSLNGLVVTTAFDAKFTSKLTKKLNLAAAYKFDDRDNQTPCTSSSTPTRVKRPPAAPSSRPARTTRWAPCSRRTPTPTVRTARELNLPISRPTTPSRRGSGSRAATISSASAASATRLVDRLRRRRHRPTRTRCAREWRTNRRPGR